MPYRFNIFSGTFDLVSASAPVDTTPGGTRNVLVLEDGSSLLLEDGSYLLLEA